VQPGSVRTIEYEIVPTSQAVDAGLTTDPVGVALRTLDQIAVLKCVDHRGQKVTAVGNADTLRTLLQNGDASNPAGMTLSRTEFPVVLPGWPPAR
jgi:hypothetical protein